jgi:hypothetical protein
LEDAPGEADEGDELAGANHADNDGGGELENDVWDEEDQCDDALSWRG